MTNFFLDKPVEVSIQSGSYNADVVAAGSEEKIDDQKKNIDQGLSYEIDKDKIKLEEKDD